MKCKQLKLFIACLAKQNQASGADGMEEERRVIIINVGFSTSLVCDKTSHTSIPLYLQIRVANGCRAVEPSKQAQCTKHRSNKLSSLTQHDNFPSSPAAEKLRTRSSEIRNDPADAFVVRYKTGVSEGALALHYLNYFMFYSLILVKQVIFEGVF